MEGYLEVEGRQVHTCVVELQILDCKLAMHHRLTAYPTYLPTITNLLRLGAS